MNVSDVMKKRKQLRCNIIQMILEFERDTGCVIEDIDVQRVKYKAMDYSVVNQLDYVDIDVRL